MCNFSENNKSSRHQKSIVTAADRILTLRPQISRTLPAAARGSTWMPRQHGAANLDHRRRPAIKSVTMRPSPAPAGARRVAAGIHTTQSATTSSLESSDPGPDDPATGGGGQAVEAVRHRTRGAPKQREVSSGDYVAHLEPYKPCNRMIIYFEGKD